ncbi:RHS repeat-associated core domain-containing protein, partial [Chryseobacterium sp.]|uniref:RHS repeat-associated core domain-containing protein n=1 Tax=Chryseobacterium sp. TaxID=1871047 RepID=UPI0028994F75
GNNLFGYKIKYNEVEGLQAPDTSETSLQVLPKYNGNIAEVDWKTSTQENEPLKRYGYVYDGLNRLSAGFYQNDMNPSIREYYEKVTYDLNGNIKTMKRTAQKLGTTVLLADNLTYDYENNNLSNRLQKVSDAVTGASGFPYKATPTNIGYDSNGNMTSFPDKNISSIEYNYLNLPKKITQDAQVTDYVYRADGVKIKKLFGGLQTDYLDGFQYKFTYYWEDETGAMTTDGMKLRIIPTSEGYYDALLGLYVYNYVDHLGNVRIGYADSDHDGTIRGRDTRVSTCYPTGDGGMACIDSFIPGEIVSNNTYYPFGMLFDHNIQAVSENAYKYKYNGKELQETGMYDYGARFYMPDIGRWGVVDPLAEVYPGWSPYNYTLNDPINYTDPDGKWVRGAGFWNNITKSDARIRAEQWADQLGSGYYNVTVNKGNNGTWDVTSHTLISSVKDTFNSEGLTNTLYIPYSQGGGLGTAPSSGDPWGPKFSSVPDSRGKTDFQMQVSENPLVQGAVLDVVTGGIGGKLLGRLFSSSKKVFNAEAFADEIVALNKATDGGGALLNGSPSSAINSAMYYETAAEQGASIFKSISNGHMFMNGNKRTAVATFESFAKQHGIKTVSKQQMMNVSTQVATGKVTDVSQIAKMLTK